MRILFLLILMMAFNIGNAQQQGDSGQTPAANVKRIFDTERENLNKKLLNPDSLISQTRQLSDEQFRTELARERQKQVEVDDEKFAMRHRWRSFDFQYTASIIIFIVVIVIVLSGLVFAGWQFSFTLKQLRLKEQLIQLSAAQANSAAATPPSPLLPPGSPPQEGEVDNQQALAPGKKGEPALLSDDLTSALKTELELSTTGIKVNSSILGVVILALSIAFFYLYIIYIYPIKYVSSGNPLVKSDSSVVNKEN